MYIGFPPELNFALYKIILFFVIGIFSGTLAIRIKEKMIISWLIILLRFVVRPKYFIFNKNDLTEREIIREEIVPLTKKAKVYQKAEQKQTQRISFGQAIQFEKFINNPKASISFRFERKGGLNVSVSEIR